MKKIDLHLHSTASDGLLSPRALVDLAIEKKVLVIAITDHDSAQGVQEALKHAEKKPIEIVPGIEITVTPPAECKELHVVGLFIDPLDDSLANIKTTNRARVEEVVKEIIKKLNGYGYDIRFEELLAETGGEHLGRPFIARILMRKYPLEFKDRKDVFDKLLGQNGKAFVPPQATPLREAIALIHNAGGLAFIAHPWYLGSALEPTVEAFVAKGGDGIERDFAPKDTISPDIGARLDSLIKKYGLLVSGGTDFHGDESRPIELGERGISAHEFDRLKSELLARRARRKQTSSKGVTLKG